MLCNVMSATFGDMWTRILVSYWSSGNAVLLLLKLRNWYTWLVVHIFCHVGMRRKGWVYPTSTFFSLLTAVMSSAGEHYISKRGTRACVTACVRGCICGFGYCACAEACARVCVSTNLQTAQNQLAAQ